MTPSTMDDASLIRNIAHQQNDEALGELYDRYNRLVFSIAVGLLGDARLAEEVTIDVFTQIWEKAQNYSAEKASVKTWIAALSRYRAIDVLRRRDARPEGSSIALEKVETQLTAGSANPEEATEQSLEAELVRSALAELPEEQLEVIKLAYYAGLTQRRIAQELDIPLGTVKTRVRLAMEKLERRLS